MTETTTEAPGSDRRRRADMKAARARRYREDAGATPRAKALCNTNARLPEESRSAFYRRMTREGARPMAPRAKPAPQPPDTCAVERALDLTLAALMAHRAQQERQHEGQDLSPVRFVLLALRKPPTPAESAIQALLRDPVEHALGTALSDLGRHLFDITGAVDGMRQVCDRVAELDPAQASYRVSILEAAWDGIGRGDERWWR